jgi:hypothetical protein
MSSSLFAAAALFAAAFASQEHIAHKILLNSTPQTLILLPK